MSTEKKANELSLDSLSEVSGGRVKLGGYALLTAMMAQYKALGKDKDYCIKVLQEGWETDILSSESLSVELDPRILGS